MNANEVKLANQMVNSFKLNEKAVLRVENGEQLPMNYFPLFPFPNYPATVYDCDHVNAKKIPLTCD